MLNPIRQNSVKLLQAIIETGSDQFDAFSLGNNIDLTAEDIKDALKYLEDLGAVELIALHNGNFIGQLLSRGKYLYHEVKEQEKSSQGSINDMSDHRLLPERPLNPVGSPYGFTEDDWLEVAVKKEEKERLYVVLGYQFESKYYNSNDLAKNIETHLREAIQKYNKYVDETVELDFTPLAAGYGEHLFNQIARDIIASDIAIFETSDLNPNVMIELGVALTWGIRVVPFRASISPAPPSDISGQTWLKHDESGKFVDDDKFEEKLFKMVKRAIEVKGRK